MQDAPDSVTIQSEQFQVLADMWMKAPDRIPLEMVIEASSLQSKVKAKLLESIQKPPPDPMQMRGQEAEIAKTESEAVKNFAAAEEAMRAEEAAAITAKVQEEREDRKVAEERMATRKPNQNLRGGIGSGGALFTMPGSQ